MPRIPWSRSSRRTLSREASCTTSATWCCGARSSASPCTAWCGPSDQAVYSILFYSITFYHILLYPILLYSTLFYSILLYSTLFSSFLLYSILFYSILGRRPDSSRSTAAQVSARLRPGWLALLSAAGCLAARLARHAFLAGLAAGSGHAPNLHSHRCRLRPRRASVRRRFECVACRGHRRSPERRASSAPPAAQRGRPLPRGGLLRLRRRGCPGRQVEGDRGRLRAGGADGVTGGRRARGACPRERARGSVARRRDSRSRVVTDGAAGRSALRCELLSRLEGIT